MQSIFGYSLLLSFITIPESIPKTVRSINLINVLLTSFMRMLKNNLGYPRVGTHRELKKACEQYWAGKINRDELFNVARNLRKENWKTQQDAGIDLIPCN